MPVVPSAVGVIPPPPGVAPLYATDIPNIQKVVGVIQTAPLVPTVTDQIAAAAGNYTAVDASMVGQTEGGGVAGVVVDSSPSSPLSTTDHTASPAPPLAGYDIIHDLLNYGTAFWWFIAYAALLQKLRRERSALGLSLQTLFALVFVEVNNVILIVSLAVYLGKPVFQLDFWIVDCTTAIMSAYTFAYVYRNFFASYEKQKDTFGRKLCSVFCCFQTLTEHYYGLFLYVLSALIALPIFLFRHTAPSSSSTSSILSFWECFDDSVLSIALLPQLFMFYNKRPRKVNALLGRFVVCLLLARALAFAYWLTFPLFHAVPQRGRGVHLFTEALNLLILSDFVFYYIKAKLKGHQHVTLPI
eukprot:GHVS01007682.1.p1 GENE.GHVS01007682.1~~GHVS01007682.1.p1  ORF type:complete len:357 (+),score=55.77 GHVS01007682.1:243-1313(+)